MWNQIELFLARVWRVLLVGALAFAIVSCAVSRIVEDPVTGEERVVVVGKHILPGAADGIEDVTGLSVEDALGAAGDALSEIDPVEVIRDVDEGNWGDIALYGGGALLTAILGYRKRQFIKNVLRRRQT